MLELLLEKVDFVQHIFDVFPDGVAWNILKFCEHPVARIYKDNIREIHFTKNHDIFAIMINDCPLILLNEITSNMRIIIIDDHTRGVMGNADTIRYNGDRIVDAMGYADHTEGVMGYADNIIVFNDVSEYLFYINYI